MKFLLLLGFAALAAGCASTSNRIAAGLFVECEQEGMSEDQCKEYVGCPRTQSRSECLRSFKKRHSMYIDYD